MKRKHIESDGNGGFWISKPFALISLIITLVLILSSFVFGYAQMQMKIEAIDDNFDLIQENDKNIHELQLMTIRCADSIDSMDEDLTEIKSDIKELLKR